MMHAVNCDEFFKDQFEATINRIIIQCAGDHGEKQVVRDLRQVSTPAGSLLFGLAVSFDGFVISDLVHTAWTYWNPNPDHKRLNRAEYCRR